MMEYSDILALRNFFNETRKNNASDSEDDLDNEAITPNQETPLQTKRETKKSPYTKLNEELTKRREIFDEKDVADVFSEESSTVKDWKKCPQWDISYRQQVTASDVYLQMGGKNPSTASCENMIITVHLPGENRQNMDLKILKQELELISPNFYLKMPLPHPVDPQLGNAQYDITTEKLIITLLMEREFDYINF